MVGGTASAPPRSYKTEITLHLAHCYTCALQCNPKKKAQIYPTMSAQIPMYLARTFLVFLVVHLVVTNARPNHFGEGNQVVGEQDAANNLLDSGLKPWQLEVLAQRLSEMSRSGEFDWDKTVRSPEAKRQSRYRQCYFNPISCFRK